MTSLTLCVLSVISLVEINAQYNTQPPYDRDRHDQQYDRDRDRDRQGPPYSQYDRPNNPPYDRPNNPPYNQPPYDRQNNPPYNQYDRNNPQYNQYDHRAPPYGQYDRSGPPPYDRQNQYNQYNQYNQSQPYDRPNQYGNQYGNQSQYGSQTPPYFDNRDRPPYDQYDRYNRYNQPNFPNRSDQYGGNRNQPYDRNRDRYYTGNRDQYGQQWGSPNFDQNSNCCEEYCLNEDQQPYLYFATKTAYQIVAGKSTHSSNQHNVPDCTPVQFWSINRHGTRLPGANAIMRLRQLEKVHMEVIRNYEERQSYPDRGRLCPKDLDIFKRWRWNDTINERQANSLTSQGMEDLRLLARRYASRFGELLGQPYSDEVYNFQYTDTDRAHDSYQAFIEGLFRNNNYMVHANVYNDDKLIKPTKSCNAWIRQINNNPDTLREYEKFKQRQEYQQMVRDVFRRLGYRFTPDANIVSDMYDMCRYEKAWNLNQPSPWCIAFTKDHLKMLEYAEDLKYYYKSGYGNEMNRKVGCPPLKDLYEKFDRTVNGDPGGHKVTVFFTHSVTIQTFLTAMGIAKDQEPLTADNYFRQQNRHWRTSKIDPFSSNLAAVLYQCRSNERYRVMFFLNEVPVNYPDCSVGLCNWSTVKAKLERAAENCNLDFCDWNAGSTLRHNYIIYLLSVIAIFYSFSH